MTVDPAAVGLAVAQDPTLASAVQYLRDHGFAVSSNRAREWCIAQAKSGVLDAQFTMGVMLSLGLFGENDAAAARRWYQSAADLGHPAALLMLANFIEAGSNEEPPNPQLALSLVQDSAEKGYAPAMADIAIVYLEGTKLGKNRDIAWKYLRRAANLGDRQSQYIYGANLLKDTSIELVNEGIDWLMTAAKGGYAGAHRHLGYLYNSGRKGLSLDKERAEYHFSMASEIENSAVEEITTFADFGADNGSSTLN